MKCVPCGYRAFARQDDRPHHRRASFIGILEDRAHREADSKPQSQAGRRNEKHASSGRPFLFDGLKLRFLTIQPLFVVEKRPKPDNLRTRDGHVNLYAAEVQN